MDTQSDVVEGASPPADAHLGGGIFGLLLVLPALLCGVLRLLAPTWQVLVYSLQRVNMLQADAAEFIGFDNYRALFRNEAMQKSLGFTLVQAFLRLALVAALPLLFAWVAGRLARKGRLAVRILLSVPVALFMPLAIALLARAFFSPSAVSGLPWGKSLLADPSSARGTLLALDGVYVLGAALGMGLLFYLPFWRKTPEPSSEGRRGLHPLLVVWLVGMLATFALTLPAFTLNYAATQGGPLYTTSNLALMIYRLSFARFQVGEGAAVAAIILVPTLLCGLLAGYLIVAGRLGFSLAPASSLTDETDDDLPSSPALAVVLILLALGVCLFSAFLYGWGALQALEGAPVRLFEQTPLLRALGNTLAPIWAAAVGQALLAYLAAIGIGALRPLGRRSEWLLLPFSPWLFVTILPLSLPFFMQMQAARSMGTMLAQINPLLLNVPMLFMLTLFFKGQSARWRAALAENGGGVGAFMRHLILPSLPLLGLLILFSLFCEGQGLFWPLLVAQSPEQFPMSLYLLLNLGSRYATTPGVAVAGTLALALPHALFFLTGLALFQVFYLDRLTLQTIE